MPEEQTPASTNELALSMTRLWGRNAQTMARNYALDCWRKGDTPAYMRWHCVEWRIQQAQAEPHVYEATVSGLQPQRVVPRRRWYEKPLAAVLPALRQLGNSTMRGTGL
jgi:hypothetical protein